MKAPTHKVDTTTRRIRVGQQCGNHMLINRFLKGQIERPSGEKDEEAQEREKAAIFFLYGLRVGSHGFAAQLCCPQHQPPGVPFPTQGHGHAVPVKVLRLSSPACPSRA